MPHLKFTRDHRGYENTFLVDTVRRRGREQTRVLYWFRTPPQVKVGRAPIDEDAIRAIEDAYPDVTFNWNRILEARPPEPEPEPDDPRRRAKPRGTRDRDSRREARPDRPARAERPATVAPPAPAVEWPPEPPREALAAEEAVAEPEVAVLQLPVSPADHVPAARDDVREAAAGGGEDIDAEAEAVAPPGHASEPSAAERIIGNEGLIRLRARHAEVCARIATQVAEPDRQAALRTLAEGLNPDAWVTEPEVRAGLEQFEQVLDQVRREVGPARKRTRRGGRRNRRRREHQAPGAAPADTEGAVPHESEDDPTEDGDAGPDDGAGNA